MPEIENDVLNFDTTRATFHIKKLPDSISLAYFPESIIKWIELNGFDFYTLCTLSGRVLHVSPSVKKVLNFSTIDLIGQRVIDLFSPDHRKTIIRDFNRGTNQVQQFVANIRNYEGNFIWFDLSIASIHIANNNEMVYLILAKDITDKKEAEEMLVRSEKMSVAGQLAAGVAHEIRNPLTSLKGFVQLLQTDVERKGAYYKIMIDEIEKIDAITAELLFISKPMTDIRQIESVTPMINEIVTLLKAQAKRKQITINVKITENISILCDRTQIKQVFINLIKNAIEAMSEEGTITIEVLSNEKKCYIKFIDQGSGIPEHLIHKVNEPFFTTKKEGTGLGLMISNKIIKNHNGSIDIKTMNGKGSIFSISLPLPNKD
ncbi:ATP-binding protein [Paraliobacillus sp. JSM ZJ581]|uniref:ATP-binding protein n=1 Tax=Paraliobacillus sp. JSM ZJ581 TaxID=3342118 RepID=UPI0035A870BD